jgi:transcriptional regulator with PAS, ATPase and Fis domain
VPYYPGIEADPEIKVAITPNLESLVPPTIGKIINMGDRVLDSSTLLDVLGKLGQINEKTIRVYINHMSQIIPRSAGLMSILGNMIESKHHLEFSLDVVQEGIIAFNADEKIIMFNKWAENLFNSPSWKVLGTSLGQFFTSQEMQKLSQMQEFFDELISINDGLYLTNKYQLKVKDEIIGGVITLKEYKEIEKIDLKFRQGIRKRGYISRYTFDDIIGNSPLLLETLDLARMFAQSDSSVLIQGESGTGKELIAQAIHNASRLKGKPFVAFNCAAIPDALIESELFGYEEGAFTGAKKNGKPGLFELAHKGTIFLDEIGDISRNMQARLLRVLQEKVVVRVGGIDVIPVDVRVIAATNQDLWKLVKEEKFRKDLLYRLNVLYLRVPPLCERKSDIPYLVEHLLAKRGFKKDISYDIMRVFQSYNWPGNVRELENCLEYMISMQKHIFSIKDIPPHLFETEDTGIFPDLSGLGDEQELLAILRDLKNKDAMGSGRRSLQQELSSQGFNLTEQEIRGRLKKLAAVKLVIISPGRTGTKISQLGKELLKRC